MARKLDSPRAAVPGDPLRLPYESDVVSSLVRIIAVWTSSAFQRDLAVHPAIPDDDNAIAALFGLAARGPMRVSILGSALRTSPPATSRLLERLAGAGLVVREADPGDARAALVRLTALGQEVALDLVGTGDRLAAELLEDWSAGDRDALAGFLHRLADAVENRANTEQPPGRAQ